MTAAQRHRSTWLTSIALPQDSQSAKFSTLVPLTSSHSFFGSEPSKNLAGTEAKRMGRKNTKATRAGAIAGCLVLMASLSVAQRLHYPAPRKTEQKDNYNGVKVSDPYPCLEDEHSQETARRGKAE